MMIADERNAHTGELFAPNPSGLQIKASIATPFENEGRSRVNTWNVAVVEPVFVEVVTEVDDEITSWL